MKIGYFKRNAISLTQFFNTLLNGWPDESFSSRTWRKREQPGWSKLRKFIDKIFFWEEAHCEKSFNQEKELRHLPPELRELPPELRE